MGGELRWGERWGRGGSVYVTMGESSSRLDADLPVGCIKPPPPFLLTTPHAALQVSLMNSLTPQHKLWWNYSSIHMRNLRRRGRCCLCLHQGRNFSSEDCTTM